MTSGVYSITHEGGMRYIGSAVDVASRWRGHRNALRLGTHCNPRLQNTFRKYGEAAFAFDVLEECEPSELLEREQWWLDISLPAAYNTCLVAGSCLGVKRTEETRRRLSEARKGKKRKPFTEEHRRRMSEALKGKKRKPFTEEARRHMSEALKGKKRKPFTEEARRRMSEAWTEERRQRLSEAQMGKKPTEETRRRIREALKGRTWKPTEAQRRRLREACEAFAEGAARPQLPP